MRSEPRRWTKQELHDDVALSIVAFRQKRIGEPLSVWRQTYFEKRKMVRRAFEMLALRTPLRPHSRAIASIYRAGLGDVLRYMAAPPISADDLKTLADSTLSGRNLAQPHQARSVLRILLASLDTVRFPWFKKGARPSVAEWKAAIATTAALLTNQAVATYRRNSGKNEQEEAVKAHLRAMGLSEVAPRVISTMSNAPKAGEFCGESEVMGEKADVVVSLFDDRLLLIECKVSNSALNSVKRVVHEAGGKAAHWIAQLGKAHAVPAAALSGVFKARNLLQVQDKGLGLFWAHRLDDLSDFIESTKSKP